MTRPLLLLPILLALAGCADMLATAYAPVKQQIVGIVTEKKDPPLPPPPDPAAPAPAPPHAAFTPLRN